MPKVQFEGVNWSGVAVFKNIESEGRYGDLNVLFPGTSEVEVLKKINPDKFLYLGESFDCEPMGLPAKVEIIMNDPPIVAQRMKHRVKFEGIDSGDRAVFKKLDCNSRYGALEIFFPMGADEAEVLESVIPSDLVYFGESFDCDPIGAKVDLIFEIVAESD